jgi:glycosyltransferase involved in cell wall biosynthesis
MMLVGLDARTLTTSFRSGVEHYVVNLVRALAGLQDSPEIIAYLDGPIPDPELARVAASGGLRTEIVRAKRGWLRAALPLRLRRDKIDLVHLPSTIVPRLLPCPAVVTVHDLAWAHYPESYDPRDLRMQTRAVPPSVHRAAHVIAVSESTARDLQETLKVPAEKISVTPLGVSSRFSPEGPRLAGSAFPGAERLAGCVLYVGRLQERKNLVRLLDAYAQVRSRRQAPHLVLAGRESPHGRELARKAQELGIAEHVIFAGYVPDDLLPAVYRSATVFVYPSLYEGFGLSVLEAMASGTPVITSDRPSLAEVAGDAGWLVNPENVAELASSIERVLTDGRLRDDLRARGLTRSREFRWERTAQRTAAVYRRIASGG